MNLVDLTLCVTRQMRMDAKGNELQTLSGHLGTHFDVMNKVFPLEYTRRNGIVFDVRNIEYEIQCDDIALDKVEKDMFVGFCANFIEKEGYGSYNYSKNHPVLSYELIDRLLEKGVSIIAIDFQGVRRGKEHTPCDQYCADHNVFIIENCCNLDKLIDKKFIAHTYPLNYEGMSGLPSRVIGEIYE